MLSNLELFVVKKRRESERESAKKETHNTEGFLLFYLFLSAKSVDR